MKKDNEPIKPNDGVLDSSSEPLFVTKSKSPVPSQPSKPVQTKNEPIFTAYNALEEFEELKRIALNCYDKNGNPNILAAIRAVENKAKIAGLYSQNNFEIETIVKMGEITIDGQQLRLNIGEEFF